MLSKLDKDACIASKELEKLSRCAQVNLFDLCVSFFSLQSSQRPLVVKRDRCSLFVAFDQTNEKTWRGRENERVERKERESKLVDERKRKKERLTVAQQDRKRRDPLIPYETVFLT